MLEEGILKEVVEAGSWSGVLDQTRDNSAGEVVVSKVQGKGEKILMEGLYSSPCKAWATDSRRGKRWRGESKSALLLPKSAGCQISSGGIP